MVTSGLSKDPNRSVHIIISAVYQRKLIKSRACTTRQQHLCTSTNTYNNLKTSTYTLWRSFGVHSVFPLVQPKLQRIPRCGDCWWAQLSTPALSSEDGTAESAKLLQKVTPKVQVQCSPVSCLLASHQTGQKFHVCVRLGNFVESGSSRKSLSLQQIVTKRNTSTILYVVFSLLIPKLSGNGDPKYFLDFKE